MSVSGGGELGGSRPGLGLGLGRGVRLSASQGRHAVVLAMTAVLLAFLRANHWLFGHHPCVWIVVPAAICASLWSAQYSRAELPAIRLWQLTAYLSAAFALLHYPLMPISANAPHAALAYGLLLTLWAVALACGVACTWIPALAVAPPAFLVWSEAFAVYVTGLPNANNLDVIPLPEIAVCIGAGLVLLRIVRRWIAPRLAGAFAPDPHREIAPLDDFAQLLVLLGVAVYLANYFWSFAAKSNLRGQVLGWLLHNNSAYMFLTALQNHYIIFQRQPQMVRAVYWLLNSTYPFSNFGVLIAQAAAVLGFFLPKRGLMLLLIAYDVMHVSIIVSAGLNFWPWIVLNLLIGAVIVRHDFSRVTLMHRCIAALVVLFAPAFFSTAKLGWFDSGAANRVFVQAIDTSGRRYFVSTNFFTFYSYPIAHMDYGVPGPDTAFSTGRPNGAATSWRQFIAGRRCDVAALTRPGQGGGLDRRLLTFLADYHRLAVALQDRFGGFPYDVYPYHFYVPIAFGAEFAHLDKHRVAAYVVRRESACLSFGKALQERVVSTAETRVDVR